MRGTTTKYSRHNPSARYRRLLELYREMHVKGELIRGIAPDTVQAPEYRQQLFSSAAARRPELQWEVRAYTKGEQADARLGNSSGADLSPIVRA